MCRLHQCASPQIDDPVGAFALHGVVGIWGVLFPGFLARPFYVVRERKKERSMRSMITDVYVVRAHAGGQGEARGRKGKTQPFWSTQA
jgi:ammonia channel protein AmtB